MYLMQIKTLLMTIPAVRTYKRDLEGGGGDSGGGIHLGIELQRRQGRPHHHLEINRNF